MAATPGQRRRAAALALLAAAAVTASACGDTLVDHRAPELFATNDAARCGEGQVICGGVCTTQSVLQCGTGCSPCPAAPADAVAVCVPTGPGDHDGVCDFQCVPGLLRSAPGDLQSCRPAALVAAGGDFTCASSEAGDVHCFGAGDRGQLGDGTQVDRLTSGRVPSLAGVTALAAGGAHACAIGAGQTRCWGVRAAFGNGAELALEPEAVPSFAGATALSAGSAHTCAIVAGKVRCRGAAAAAGGGDPELAGTALAIAAGGAFSCALVQGAGGNAVQCWGEGTLGQLGGGAAPPSATPVTVALPFVPVVLGAGARHACAGGAAGDELACWGDNAFHQLGPATGAVLPPTIHSKVNKPVLGISAGDRSTCVVEDDPPNVALSCWSADGLVSGGAFPAGEQNHLGGPGAAPGVLSAGKDHACFVALTPGAPRPLACFGGGGRGQLGNGAVADSTAPVFVLDR